MPLCASSRTECTVGARTAPATARLLSRLCSRMYAPGTHCRPGSIRAAAPAPRAALTSHSSPCQRRAEGCAVVTSPYACAADRTGARGFALCLRATRAVERLYRLLHLFVVSTAARASHALGRAPTARAARTPGRPPGSTTEPCRRLATPDEYLEYISVIQLIAWPWPWRSVT